MSEHLWSALIPTLMAPLVAGVTWWLSRRKRDAETDSSIAAGAHTAVEAITHVMKELRAELRALEEENDRLRMQLEGDENVDN